MSFFSASKNRVNHIPVGISNKVQANEIIFAIMTHDEAYFFLQREMGLSRTLHGQNRYLQRKLKVC